MATKTGIIVLTRSQPVSVALVKGSYSHKWGFPKGNVEPNESPKKAAVREFKEETGATILEPRDDVTLYVKSDTPKNFYIDIVDRPFEMNPEDEEVLEAKWMPLDQLSLSNSYTYDVKLFYKIINGHSKIPEQRRLARIVNAL